MQNESKRKPRRFWHNVLVSRYVSIVGRPKLWFHLKAMVFCAAGIADRHLALVLCDGLFGCSTAKSQNVADEKTWQTTLRAAVTNNMFPPFSFSSIGIMIYVVPADAAKILESQPPSELMPFLIKLRASQSSWEAGTVDEWSNIVRYGLRGTPSTNTLTSTNGTVTSTTEIPVYNYTDNYLQRTHNFTKQLSDILTECQKIKPGMTRAELLKVFMFR